MVVLGGVAVLISEVPHVRFPVHVYRLLKIRIECHHTEGYDGNPGAVPGPGWDIRTGGTSPIQERNHPRTALGP